MEFIDLACATFLGYMKLSRNVVWNLYSCSNVKLGWACVPFEFGPAERVSTPHFMRFSQFSHLP